MNSNPPKFCKRVVFDDGESMRPTVLYGVVSHEDEHFLEIRTARRKHLVSKSCILAISETEVPFDEGDGR